MTYLPDTNVLIYALSGKEPHHTSVNTWIEENQLVLSSIVTAEYLSNATSQEEAPFRKLMQICRVLPVDADVALQGALYRKQFTRKQKKVWLIDCLIAATCKVFGATLVTSDKRDYPMIDIPIVMS